MIKKPVFVLAVGLLFLAPVWAQEPAGEVVDFKGGVLMETAGKKGVEPAFKQPVYVGDVIETQKTGSVKILFRDDTLLTVKENSKTVISEFLFNPDAKKRKTVFNVLFGRIRTVVGRFFGTDELVEIKTQNAVAGIRGTDAVAIVTNISTQFFCFTGVFDAYNIKSPAKVIKVTEGTYTEIVRDQPPSETLPIPNRDEMRKGYDISLGLPEKSREKEAVPVEPSAGTQIVESARQASTPAQTGGTSGDTPKTASTGPVEVTFVEEAIDTSNQYNYYFQSGTPTTTTQGQTEILPGAKADSGSPGSGQSSVIINFPQ